MYRIHLETESGPADVSFHDKDQATRMFNRFSEYNDVLTVTLFDGTKPIMCQTSLPKMEH